MLQAVRVVHVVLKTFEKHDQESKLREFGKTQ